MKNKYDSINKARNDDFYINSKKNLIIRLKFPKTEAKEILDLDYLQTFQRNDSVSIRSNSSFSSASSSASPRSDSDESFTFQDFVSSILNNENKEYQILIIQDIARLIELKFREFKKRLANSKSLQQTLNTNFLTVARDSDLFIKVAEEIFKQANEEPNGILGTKIKLNLIYDNNLINLSESFAYDSTTMPTSEIIVNLRHDKPSGDLSVGGFGFIKKCLKYLHSKYFQTIFTIDSNNFDTVKNRLY